ncbi:MAG TPA: SPOR domain-containing protein [Candidatus Nitrosotalea sp.]|nr:SPOR domain-containing protein [Candidatus Nitrosotalea sp.]
MSPERPEHDDFLEDEEQEEYEGQRSIFATGWFRAVLVLLVLAVIAVIAVPLIGGWFEPTPPPKVTTTKPSEPSPPLVPAPSTPAPAPTSPPAQTPSTSAPPATSPGVGTPPPATTPPTAAMPTPAPPVTAPAPTPAPARPETPTASTPSKAPEKAKAPERTAAVTPGKSAAKAPAVGSGSYWVQVGAFKESRNAEGLAKTLRSEGFGVQITQVTRDQPMHVVRVGGYPDRAKAAAAREELQGKGHTGFVTSGPAK